MPSWPAAHWAYAVALLDVALVVCVGLGMDRRWPREPRLLLWIAASALAVAAAPWLADLGSSPAVAALPGAAPALAVVGLAALAQSGLWAQTFFATGLLLDALHGRRPRERALVRALREGAAKGAIFGGAFMVLIHALAWAGSSAGLAALVAAAPLLVPLCAGALLFPLAKTVVESFDGSAPFFGRLAANFATPQGYLRGLAVAAGLAFAWRGELPEARESLRFAAGGALGALAYAGVDLVWDALGVARGFRPRLQSWRVYLLGALLGGAVGGMLGWYAEPSQLRVIAEKLASYAAVSYEAVGRPISPYVFYPFFSKWGAVDLGQVSGGLRLFFCESLSGVIGWSIAAPLFGVNLTLLTALLRRDVAPIRELASGRGLVALGEQTIRVLRWGPWMAPVIYSFLRLSPDPTWFNQDGAVRSAVATLHALVDSPADFRHWSLEVFIGLLAYDWLRVLIWFDHMGLRVATLVNLSFVGGDIVDEKAAHFVGHSVRSRSIPEGIRRFATWGPLLIPFYIPRGAEWDQAWSGAEVVRNAAGPPSPAVMSVVVGYALAGALVALALAAWHRHEQRRRRANGHPPPRRSVERFVLRNGEYTFEVDAEGRGFSRVLCSLSGAGEIDLTRRPEDVRSDRGKLFYLREIHGDGSAEAARGPVWTLTARPLGAVSREYRVAQPRPAELRIENCHEGVRAEARVVVHPTDAVEHWRIRLANLEQRPRTLEIVSYQPLALDRADAYRRHPRFGALHVGTAFVRSLGAILAHHRKLHASDRSGLPTRRPVAFHAVAAGREGPVRLTGYEDSRARFLGTGTLAAPRALAEGRARDPEDEGRLYTFDPAASLRVEVTLPAGGEVDVCFADGFAADEHDAARLIARHLGTPPPAAGALDAALGRQREIDDSRRPEGAGLPFRFGGDGRSLEISGLTPRPWAHVVASPLGHGALISDDGAIYSFSGNSQQNGLTPFSLDSVVPELPGQLCYVVDLASGAIGSPSALPSRRPDGGRHVEFTPGAVRFRQGLGELALELELCAHPTQPLEVRCLRIHNGGGSAARVRVVSYLEWMLAELPSDSRGRLRVQADPALSAVFCANPHNEYQSGCAFAATSLRCDALETQRGRFLGGMRRDFARPHFVEHGRGDDDAPDDGARIAAFAGELEVPAGATATVGFVIGEAPTRAAAEAWVRRYLDADAAQRAVAETREWWDSRLDALRIETNVPAFDRLVNDWLPYQALCSRLWARAGPDQRSGAFGFRDQLQDVLPLLFHDPALARRQIVLHAAQQFLEGDVLQWWHPAANGTTGLGARTRSSDVALWLPYVVARYVRATGDAAVLDEPIAFLEGMPIPRGASGLVFAPRSSGAVGTLAEHCRRAIDLGLAHRGPHGLPLLGLGDWNDALDRPGAHGRGESVWLGFFLYDVLMGFAELAGARGGDAMRARYAAEAERLRGALDGMWRGDRYVRATTDSGEELAYVDALTAAWPALSGAADFARARDALETGLRELERDGVVLLLTPAFDADSRPYPGRIAEYPPGVRENGGQYSHGASWLVDALTALAERAAADGQAALAAALRGRAVGVWMELSPFDETRPDRLDRYGLAPHQQPADVYFGPGYAGRGGWSGYTGAAARMLSAAYGILGLRVVDGALELPADLFEPRGKLRVRRVLRYGREIARLADSNE